MSLVRHRELGETASVKFRSGSGLLLWSLPDACRVGSRGLHGKAHAPLRSLSWGPRVWREKRLGSGLREAVRLRQGQGSGPRKEVPSTACQALGALDPESAPLFPGGWLLRYGLWAKAGGAESGGRMRCAPGRGPQGTGMERASVGRQGLRHPSHPGHTRSCRGGHPWDSLCTVLPGRWYPGPWFACCCCHHCGHCYAHGRLSAPPGPWLCHHRSHVLFPLCPMRELQLSPVPDKETASERLSDLPGVTQLINGREGARHGGSCL